MSGKTVSGSVVYHDDNTAKSFVKDVIEIGESLCELLKTNTPIVIIDEDRRTNAVKAECDL